MASHEPHLWAVAYDDLDQAERTRAEITTLAGAGHYLLLLDVAILTRSRDGTYTLDREPFPLTSNILAQGTLGFLAGLALAAPMTDAAIGVLLGTDAAAVAIAVGIEESNFLCNIGYGDAAKLHPRGPRLSFEQACVIA